jgi:hypothetical protein
MIAGMNVDTGQKTWLTPPSLLQSLGPFDTDPCVPDSIPWNTATTMYTKSIDGLKQPWVGRVWLNPPYGKDSYPFLKKMSEHKNGIALLFGRTDTEAWHTWIFPYCDSVLFMKGRIKFYRQDGTQAESANAPSCLVAYTPEDTEAIKSSGIKGYLMKGA